MTETPAETISSLQRRAREVSWASYRLRVQVQTVGDCVLAVESAQRSLIQLAPTARTNAREWEEAKKFASTCTRKARAARTLMIKRASLLFDTLYGWEDESNEVYQNGRALYAKIHEYARTLEAKGY